MAINLIEDTQGIFGYHLISSELSEETLIFYIEKSGIHSCPACGSSNTKSTYIKDRLITGLPTGSKKTIIKVKLHRIKCKDCKKFRTEKITFIDSISDRITSFMAKYLIDLRKHASIHAVAQFFNLHWETVKNIEKKHLELKYKKIEFSGVTAIGIDEVFMGKTIGNKGYLTIVRDLKAGAVLYIGDGKKGECLDQFKQDLDANKVQIASVAVDLSAAFTSWIKKNLPKATIVYDHFHIIKLMNEKLANIRRVTMNDLEELEKKELKNMMWNYMKNQENLNSKAAEKLKVCNSLFHDLGTAHWLKESLRNIYKICENSIDARVGFKRWCALAIKSAIPGLKTMAKTIQKSIDGIVSYWDTGITSASMEGFNNKIGWLTRQAYGYRDEDYLKLKIFALPNLRKRDDYV